jgi:hypothetical protein
MLKMGKISPIRAPILSSILTCHLKNPVKPPFSVPVENKAYNSPVCQNKADLHLTYWPPMAFKLRQIQPVNLAHPDPGNAAGMRI